MAYSFDIYDSAIVIDGWQGGVAPDPYSGIAKLNNVNVTTVPGEASVMFSTIALSSPKITGRTVSSAATGTSTGYITVSSSAGFEAGMAISFNTVSVGGLSAGTTVYWVVGVNANGSNTLELQTDFLQTTYPNITSTGTGTFYAYAPDFSQYENTQPNKFARSNVSGYSFMVDSVGYVWTNTRTTATNNYWEFMGNTGHSSLPGTIDNSNGNGIVYYQGSDGSGWIFVWSSSSIDYVKEVSPYTWV